MTLELHNFSNTDELIDLGNNHQWAAKITKRETTSFSVTPNGNTHHH